MKVAKSQQNHKPRYISTFFEMTQIKEKNVDHKKLIEFG